MCSVQLMVQLKGLLFEVDRLIFEAPAPQVLTLGDRGWPDPQSQWVSIWQVGNKTKQNKLAFSW